MDYDGGTSDLLKAFDPSDESLEPRCIDAGCNTFCDRQRLYKDAP